jgi:hypothetical protein
MPKGGSGRTNEAKLLELSQFRGFRATEEEYLSFELMQGSV